MFLPINVNDMFVTVIISAKLRIRVDKWKI